MVHKKKFSQHLDQLIAESLHEQMGPPPSHDVWLRITEEINHLAHPTLVQESPPSKKREWWFLFSQRSILQCAFAILLLLLIAGDSAILLKMNPLTELSTNPSNTSRQIRNFSPRPRPLPQSDLRIINNPSVVEYTKPRRLVEGKPHKILLDKSASWGNIALKSTRATPK